MEKNGLITRNIDKYNRRNINIFMTEKGKEICKRIEQEFIAIEKKAFYNFFNKFQYKFNLPPVQWQCQCAGGFLCTDTIYVA